MKRKWIKKVGAMILSVITIVGVLPNMPGTAMKVYAANPSITQFATMEQLQSEFGLDTGDTVGKIKFGKDNREWLIAGQDGANTIAMLTTTSFGTSAYDDTLSTYGDDGNLSLTSTVKTYLKDTCETSTYFSTSELALMKNTAVVTQDYEGTSHTVTGKLYLADTTNPYTVGNTIYVGSATNIPIAKSNWPVVDFWLRSAFENVEGTARGASVDLGVAGGQVTNVMAVVPAFNLDVSTVSFASIVPSVASEGALTPTTAMTLRYLNYDLGNIGLYSENTLIALSAVVNENTYLVVQNSTGAWAKEVTDFTMSFYASDIDSSLASFDNCKVWLEKTDSVERITEATLATISNTSVAEADGPVSSIANSSPSFVISDGAGGTHQVNSDGTIRMICSGALSDFAGTYVDGVLVATENYLLEEGSTIVTLYPEYLNTLSIGTHTLTFIYNTGSAEASFSILDGMDEVPKTGENSISVWLFAVVFVSGMGAILISLKRKENFKYF